MGLRVRIMMVVAAVLFLVAVAGAQGRWEYIGSEEGVDIYRMEHPGTDVCTFKGVGFVDARIEVIGAVFRDIPAYPEWMASCKHAEILKTMGRDRYIIRNVVSTPFPYKDRDMVVENKTVSNFDNGMTHLTFRLAEDFDYPEQAGCVRVPELEGQYFLEYFGRDKTRVTCQYRSHPGGNVPVGLANEFQIRHYPAINIAGLRKMVKQEKYIQAGLSSPDHEMIECLLDDEKVVKSILKTRMGEYIIDPVLLDMLFALSHTSTIVQRVCANNADFKSVQQGMVALLNVMVKGEPTGKTGQAVEAIADHLADKPLDAFFRMDKLMEATWLVDAIAREKTFICGFFDLESPLSGLIFEKVAASPSVVQSFIRDMGLAERILGEPGLRQKLRTDPVIRDCLAEAPETFIGVRHFEKLIAERVKWYSL